MSAGLRQRPLKYHRIATELRQQLTELPAGARLPSERELAERYGCNVLTVRKSLSSLVDEGWIERRLGSGTFVTEREPAEARPVTDEGQVGMIACNGTGAYGQRVAQALARAAGDADVTLRSVWVENFGEEALREARRLADAGCASLVLPWFPHALSGEVGSFVRRSALPVSLPLLIPGLERHCFERPDCFGKSTLVCTEALCHYFTRLGQRRIALLGPDEPADPILQAKLSAYSCAMSRLGGEHVCGLIGPTVAAADALAARWAAYRGELAIICYDDTHALRMLTAMHKLGLTAPTDFALIGFNNIEAGPFCDPPLTTLDQDFDYIGRALLRNAQALGRDEVEQSSEPPPHRLLVRASCGGASCLSQELANEMRECGLVLADSNGAPLFDKTKRRED